MSTLIRKQTANFVEIKNSQTVKSRVLTLVTNKHLNILPKGHSTYGSKIPLISNLNRPVCALKWDELEYWNFNRGPSKVDA